MLYRGMTSRNDRFPIRPAEADDAERVFSLIEEAKASFRERGIDMWQRGYPQLTDIIGDISSRNAYVCTCGNKVIGYIFVTFGEEDFHSTLEGRWDNDNPAVFHRLIVDKGYRNEGIGTMLITFAEDLAKKNGCNGMRTETDITNTPMTSLLSDLGYDRKGNLLFNGFEKLGYEKQI